MWTQVLKDTNSQVAALNTQTILLLFSMRFISSFACTPIQITDIGDCEGGTNTQLLTADINRKTPNKNKKRATWRKCNALIWLFITLLLNNLYI